MKLIIKTEAPERITVSLIDGTRIVRSKSADGKGKTLAIVRAVVGRKIDSIKRIEIIWRGGSWSQLRSVAAVANAFAFARGLPHPAVPAYSGEPHIVL